MSETSISKIASPVQIDALSGLQNAKGSLSVQDGVVRGQGMLGRVVDWIKDKLQIGSADRAASQAAALAAFKQEVGKHYQKLGYDAYSTAGNVQGAVQTLDRKVAELNHKIEGLVTYFNPGLGRGYLDMLVESGAAAVDVSGQLDKPSQENRPVVSSEQREAFAQDFSSRLKEEALATGNLSGDRTKEIARDVYADQGLIEKQYSASFIRDQFSLGGSAAVRTGIQLGVGDQVVSVVVPNGQLKLMAQEAGVGVVVDDPQSPHVGATVIQLPKADAEQRLESYEAKVAAFDGRSTLADAQKAFQAAFDELTR